MFVKTVVFVEMAFNASGVLVLVTFMVPHATADVLVRTQASVLANRMVYFNASASQAIHRCALRETMAQ